MSRFAKVLNPRLLSRSHQVPVIRQQAPARLSVTTTTNNNNSSSVARFSTTSRRTAPASRSRAAPGAGNGATRPPLRIPPLPVALIGLGLTCLSIGLYFHLTSDIQKYPKDIRQALRKALYYEQDKDLNLSLKYFNEALTLALESDEMERDGAPLTGIMIQLGTLQERMGRLPDARQTLLLALRHLLKLENDKCSRPPYTDDGVFEVELSKLSTVDQKKVVGIAQKLGDITAAMKRDEEAEKWYVWSVEHLLAASSKPTSEYGDDGGQPIFDEEHMPVWLTRTDIGAAMEALGVFYASRKKPHLAIHLYLRALSLEGMKSCQATVMMNNLTECYSALGHFEEAKIWGQRGLDLAQNPNTRKINNDGPVCDETCGVLLFNMGMLFEQTKDIAKATEFYTSARKHGRDYKQYNCIKEADRALRRLEFEKQKSNNKL